MTSHQTVLDDEIPLEIESLCMSCEKQGITKLLLINIPMFREVAIMSFFCEHCQYSNNQLQSASSIEPFGHKFTLQVTALEDLNRQIVRSENSTFIIPELEFEAPPKGSRGILSTIEGIMRKSYEELEQHLMECPNIQENIEYIDKMKCFLQKYQNLIQLKSNFTFILDDPRGCSFIESPNAPNYDKQLIKEEYIRNKEQNDDLLHKPITCNESESQLAEENPKDDDFIKTKPNTTNSDQYQDVVDFQNEILKFSSPCSACGTECDTNMKSVDIPYFQQVILMASNCDACGFKSSEVKPSQAISDNGLRYTLKIENESDLTRDILKTHDASIDLLELDISITAGTLGGKFTTLEGILREMHDQLLSMCPFGDSASEYTQKIKLKCEQLMEIAEGKRKVTFVLTDPTGNSYIQNFYAPDSDPQMELYYYERSAKDNEELGLDEMKTEKYDTKLK